MSAPEAAILTAAELLFNARQTRRPVAPVRSLLPDGDISAAYAVQSRNLQRGLAAGARIAGRKIGLTSLAVQRQLGVAQPDFGVLLDNMDFGGDGAVVPLAALIAPKIEAEFAFRLGADITQKSDSLAGVAAAIDAVAPAAEIVDSAIANWDIGIVDTVADNASSGGFVIGAWVPYSPVLDLCGAAMRMWQDGVVVSEGVGAASMGDPLRATAWLAATAIDVGMPLRAGEIILSGALGPMVVLRPGQYRIELAGFAPLTLSA